MLSKIYKLCKDPIGYKSLSMRIVRVWKDIDFLRERQNKIGQFFKERNKDMDVFSEKLKSIELRLMLLEMSHGSGKDKTGTARPNQNEHQTSLRLL